MVSGYIKKLFSEWAFGKENILVVYHKNSVKHPHLDDLLDPIVKTIQSLLQEANPLKESLQLGIASSH